MLKMKYDSGEVIRKKRKQRSDQGKKRGWKDDGEDVNECNTRPIMVNYSTTWMDSK